ncbi:MAG TPA: TMEM175 family protein [Thermoanaerobaculia bacterium]|nr:TMEM175 family protein [Thermoanaerobaculia bacterium]
MARKIEFRYRAKEVSRIEAFSDVVFGFALSLIVISLEVPKTYDALIETMRGILPFTLCFFIFIGLWLQHHEFFKRYGLTDRTTIWLNVALLFVILFYIYPLKFMFVLVANEITGSTHGLSPDQARVLFTIYGIGFTAVNWLLAAMYWHADRLGDELQLSAIERIDTRERLYDNLATGTFGLLSILCAFTAIRLAGPIYFLLFIPKTAIPSIMGAKRKRLEEAVSTP